MISRCGDCNSWFHPPAPVCPICTSLNVASQPVSGRGTVYSYTINYQAWDAELADPFVIAIVALPEQEGLRFLSNVVGCDPSEVHIDMAVRVIFEQVDDVWIPLFEKDA
jgi:uncharacterized OB-fold protein